MIDVDRVRWRTSGEGCTRRYDEDVTVSCIESRDTVHAAIVVVSNEHTLSTTTYASARVDRAQHGGSASATWKRKTSRWQDNNVVWSKLAVHNVSETFSLPSCRVSMPV